MALSVKSPATLRVGKPKPSPRYVTIEQLPSVPSEADIARLVQQYTPKVELPEIPEPFSGRYEDLEGKPDIPVMPDVLGEEDVVALLFDNIKGGGDTLVTKDHKDGKLKVTTYVSPVTVTSVAGKQGTVTLDAADVGGLAAVATSGSYNDLSDTPVIPDPVVTLGTRAVVLADDGAEGQEYLTTDTTTHYIEYNNAKYFHPIPLVEDTVSGKNIGGQVGRITRYNATYVTDLDVYNATLGECVIGASIRESPENGAIRSFDTGGGVLQPQFYTDGEWKAILVGVRLQSDNSYRLEYNPFSTGDLWIDAHTGNSNKLGANGRPLIQGYEKDIGGAPLPRIASGRYYDGTRWRDW